MNQPKPKATAQGAPYVDALGPELAITILLKNGGAEIQPGSIPKGRSRLAIMVSHDRTKALADHPAMRRKQRVPLASKWLTRMVRGQEISTAEIARQVRVSDVTVRNWLKVELK